MKRAVLCVSNPHDYIDDLDEYSIMIINPDSTELRKKYLLENSDYSLFITDKKEILRNGSDYDNERVFWYTSGTTGDSKFYGFSKTQVERMASVICNAYDLNYNDRYVSLMPLWHAHGQGFYWATKKIGCQTDFLAARDLRKIQNFSPTFLTAVPDILKILTQFKFDQLRFVRSASAPLPNYLYQQLQDCFHVPVIEAFGMTEALSHCFTNPLHGEQRMGTVGLPDGIETRIDEEQRLWIRGPCVFTDQWVDTGDLACQDEKGYFRILGRSTDQINIRGIKINPLTIENQLCSKFPNITECAIFGKDRLKCVYVGNVNEQEVIDWLISLGSYCRPKFLQKVNEIPKNNVGKISRSLLENFYI